MKSIRHVCGVAALTLITILNGPALALAQPRPAADPTAAHAQVAHHGSEADLILPDFSQVSFRGVSSETLLLSGLVVCVLGLVFGLVIFTQLRNLAVHRSMREISELIYETCKTYLITQGRFILIL